MKQSQHHKRCYSELIQYHTFAERFDYLRLIGYPGEQTFGSVRYVNQNFYKSAEWRQIKNQIILRDQACDLGLVGYDLRGTRNILVHHINPISVDMIYDMHPYVFDPEYLITVSYNTHNEIHFGRSDGESVHSTFMPIERTLNDTIPWR